MIYIVRKKEKREIIRNYHRVLEIIQFLLTNRNFLQAFDFSGIRENLWILSPTACLIYYIKK